jgi:hypothetical protein
VLSRSLNVVRLQKRGFMKELPGLPAVRIQNHDKLHGLLVRAFLLSSRRSNYRVEEGQISNINNGARAHSMADCCPKAAPPAIHRVFSLPYASIIL